MKAKQTQLFYCMATFDSNFSSKFVSLICHIYIIQILSQQSVSAFVGIQGQVAVKSVNQYDVHLNTVPTKYSQEETLPVD